MINLENSSIANPTAMGLFSVILLHAALTKTKSHIDSITDILHSFAKRGIGLQLGEVCHKIGSRADINPWFETCCLDK